MGKVQTPCRGSHKTGGTMDMAGVYAWEEGTKETQTAQGHRRNTKEIRASVWIAGSRWGQPRAQGLQTTQRWCRRSDSGTGHTRLATEKWVRQ